MRKFILFWFIAGLLGSAWWVVSHRDGHVRRLQVQGESMSPTLHSGDEVGLQPVVDGTYQAGDMVAIRFKTRERMLVKRIIALPGDRVERRQGHVFVNDRPLVMAGWTTERVVPERSWRVLGIQLRRYGHVVPDNTVIVMGDNAANSYDSGDFGLISLDQLQGRIKPR